MAKAASNRKGMSRGSRAGKGSARRGGVGKGELEVGNVRRDSGAAGPLPRAAAKRGGRQAGLQLPGEKAVTPTKRTIPVEPRRTTPTDLESMPTEALDRRRQVIGTDEKRGRGRR